MRPYLPSASKESKMNKEKVGYIALGVIVLAVIIFLGLLFTGKMPTGVKDKNETTTISVEKPAPIPRESKREATAEPREKVVIPQYTVLDERIDDARLLYAKVTLSVLVSGDITADGLKALLNELYSSIKARKGFKYHDSPTTIFIYAYTKEYADSYPMGQWIAMLIKTDEDESKKPEISINDSQIAQLGAIPVEKFGLSEEKRKEIYQETWKAEDRARIDAQKKYPEPYYKHLQAGETYQLPKGAPLMPEMEPIDPFGAIARTKTIQPGENIEIFEAKLDKHRSVWYFVKATDAYGREIGWGYVNSLALASQFEEEAKERMQKNAEFQERLMEKYKAELAQKYNLTEDQLYQIEIEGMVKDWLLPKRVFPAY